MTRRPRKVGGAGDPGRTALPAPPTILLVDRDEGERAMVRDALLEGTGPFDLRTVAGASELDAYLARGGTTGAPRPSLVLVDLDREDPEPFAVVERVKGDPEYRRIPVVALAGAADAALAAGAYDAGVNTVLPKPVTFLALVRLVKVLTSYWLEAAILPREAAA